VPLACLFVAVNGLVLVNAVLHDPRIAYDAGAHVKYVVALSEFRLPTVADTHEYFNPPLSYLAPALVYSTGAVPLWATVKLTQILNAAASLGLTWCLLRFCESVRPGNALFKMLSLGLLGMLPVYYRSFAFVRPEPLLALLTVIGACLVLPVVMANRPRIRDLLALGAVFGLLLLTRQQGLFVIVATAVFVALGVRRVAGARRALVATTVIVAATLIMGGWYYIHLYRSHGSPVAFPRALHFSLSNKPAEFYFGLGLPALFQSPLRPMFDQQFFPVMYADTWGDYYLYFLVWGKDSRDGSYVHPRALGEGVGTGVPSWLDTNHTPMGRYLGRVNAVSLLPSAILLGGVMLGLAALRQLFRAPDPDDRPALARGLWGLIVAMSIATYIPLVIAVSGGGTVKATYLLHVFPFAALLGAEALLRTRARAPRLASILLVALLLVGLHNAGTYVTRYATLDPAEAKRRWARPPDEWPPQPGEGALSARAENRCCVDYGPPGPKLQMALDAGQQERASDQDLVSGRRLDRIGIAPGTFPPRIPLDRVAPDEHERLPERG
jgi:hypothetical protein